MDLCVNTWDIQNDFSVKILCEKIPVAAGTFSASESEYPLRCNIHFIRLISDNSVQLHLMKTVN